MGRCLLVANQTLGGEELERTIRDRIARGDHRFFIVVPLTAPKHETAVWAGGFPLSDHMAGYMSPEVTREVLVEDARRRDEQLTEAHRRAESRLEQMVEAVRAAGGEAEGVVGAPEPTVAVQDVLEEQSFDEVIVSTLPTSLSRWLRMDLPSRIARMTDVPVTTVEAGEDHG
jgi:nucleotide-binding universal stress UspA family protein